MDMGYDFSVTAKAKLRDLYQQARNNRTSCAKTAQNNYYMEHGRANSRRYVEGEFPPGSARLLAQCSAMNDKLRDEAEKVLDAEFGSALDGMGKAPTDEELRILQALALRKDVPVSDYAAAARNIHSYSAKAALKDVAQADGVMYTDASMGRVERQMDARRDMEQAFDAMAEQTAESKVIMCDQIVRGTLDHEPSMFDVFDVARVTPEQAIGMRGARGCVDVDGSDVSISGR